MYYKVLTGSGRYHGDEALTYESDQKLSVGALVVVPLRQQTVMGVVIEKTTKPTFTTKLLVRSLDLPTLPTASLQLLSWLRSYYPAPLGIITSLFFPTSLTREPRQLKDAPTKPLLQPLPPLTSEQKQVMKEIKASPRQRTVLLHGDTGTGKTRIYMELAEASLRQSRSVLVLTPEISLTPQLVRQFEESFSQEVIVLHSNLGEAARRLAWTKILKSTTTPVIVIGPRSALFAPFHNLGLIVVDEAHEPAYKQESAPYYNSLRVAAKLADLQQARLVMGTATPIISEYSIAKAKKALIIRMTTLATTTDPMPAKVLTVLARDRDQFSQNPYLSDELLKAIKQSLAQKEQILIFLNRRGTARLVMCQNCGWQAFCPNCDLPLTYHADQHNLRCHTCGYSAAAITHCPVCNSTDILYKSIGTKSIVEALTKLFPEARIQRFDTDNTKAESFEKHYAQVSSGDVDIIVGTQLLVKGLDLPKLSLVGVVAADTSLSFPDYTAEERTYQLMAQIIGRVGRGHRQGQAIIQTYNPGSLAITAAISHDWENFYKAQLAERKQYLFPPFCYLLKLTIVRKRAQTAEDDSQKLADTIRKAGLHLRVEGPVPGFYEKTKDGYRWQLIVKSKDRSSLLKVVELLPAGWSYDLDPFNLL